MSDSIFLTDGNGVLTGLVDTDYTGELVIPEYVAGERIISINQYAFFDCYFTSITIPDSVTSIGNGAFYDCIDLASIYMPNSIISIGEHAFYGCNSLTSVTIPDSVTSIGNNAFEYCLGLTSINIPNGVTNISEYTFYGCYNLTSITIPNSVTSIGNSAFYGCSRLTSVYVPDPNNLSTAVSSYDWTDADSSNITFLQDPAYIDYLIKGGSLISLADKIRILSGSDEKMGLNEMIESVGSHRCPTVAELTSSGDATAADIAAGKKAWVDGVEIVGTLVGSEVAYGTITSKSATVYVPGMTDNNNFAVFATGAGSGTYGLTSFYRINGEIGGSHSSETMNDSMVWEGCIGGLNASSCTIGSNYFVTKNRYVPKTNLKYVAW